ncbi:NAD(P)-dependent oxidoreductase [Helicobacter didelphidarum]|uniref:NAD(P)-dependent oxidoreductase n=1 Tax=Helicobacter didelphidarum TaxID=2040648 RepID=A0A3D8IRC0_9HELI|nr:SDR family NAD(P)-dependent oxidoreductase [Helicobacter didelphidarum]RDU67144.1 NAD(P)-dependent oxidoreductase [Helicobacter didelphidarum]
MNILITGASSGFGRSLALKYAHEWDNLQLYLVARRGEKLQILRNEILTMKKNISVILGTGDVCNKSFIDNFTNNIDVDILVNNAGLARGIESAEKTQFHDWEEMIEVNIKALSYLTHKILPSMVKRKSGHIINIGSIAGTYPYPGGNVYGASKAFVKQFSRNLRADLYDKNIRISNIEPGLCDGSDFSITRFHGDSQKAQNVYANTFPLHADDIANIIFWVSTQPQHININSIEVMPTTQASAGLNVYRI